MADVATLWPELIALEQFLISLTSKVWTVQMASTGGGAAPTAAAQQQAPQAAASHPAPSAPDLSWLALI